MSLDFKHHYDRLRESDPTKPIAKTETVADNSFYEGPGHARNLCLIWPDGKQQFISYSYLVGGELTVNGELNVITLNFSAYTVTLKGYRLTTLFNALLDSLPRYIVLTDQRYVDSVAEDQSVVIEMAATKNER